MNLSVYVSTYALYNANQSLEGIWVELDDFSSKEEFHLHLTEHFNEIDPSNENSHEFMFQDKPSQIPDSLLSEGHVSPELFDLLDSTYDEDEILKVFAVINDGLVSTIEEVRTFVEDNYVCEKSEFKDYIIDYFIEVNEVSEHTSFFLDEEKIIREYSYDFTIAGDYVFHNC